MKLISTHNSGTGEPSRRWIDRLFTPFARCQGKTLCEQYHAGCRYFDLRCRRDENGTFRLAHGLWQSKTTLCGALGILYYEAFVLNNQKELTYVAIGLEHGGADELQSLKHEVRQRIKHAPNIVVTYWDTKQGGWHIDETDYNVPLRCDFADLNLRLLSWKKPATWRVLLPIPWFWAKLRPRPTFNERTYTQVDWL